MIPELAERKADLERVCRQHHVRRMELFGSAATGRFRPDQSDLDFLIEFEPIPPSAYADTYFGLRESLEQLFGRPVDLVVASTIKNPYFQQSVERTKALLYAS